MTAISRGDGIPPKLTENLDILRRVGTLSVVTSSARGEGFYFSLTDIYKLISRLGKPLFAVLNLFDSNKSWRRHFPQFNIWHCSAEREHFRSIYFKFDEWEGFLLLRFKFAVRGNMCFPARRCCYIKVQNQYVYFPCGRAIISDMISDVNSDVISDVISSVTSEASPK